MQDETDKPAEADLPETGQDAETEAPEAETEATSAPEVADPEAAGTVAAPDSAPDTEAVAAAPGATPAPDAADAAPIEDKARAARKPRTQAQKEKRKADDVRRKAAIAAAPRPTPTKEATADDERKAALQEELQAVQADIEEAETVIAAAKERVTELLHQLYPSLGKSDRHVDAVRGYIKSEKELRANRALAPARLKAMLEAAGKAPIDAAFSVQRARGMARPVRSPPPPAAGEGDAGKTAAAAE